MVKFTVQYHTLAMSLFQLFLYWGVPRISQETKTFMSMLSRKTLASGIEQTYFRVFVKLQEEIRIA